MSVQGETDCFASLHARNLQHATLDDCALNHSRVGKAPKSIKTRGNQTNVHREEWDVDINNRGGLIKVALVTTSFVACVEDWSGLKII